MSEPRPATVYVVALHHWTYNDSWFDGENRPVAAFRDRAAAERERERLEKEARADVARAARTSGYSEFEEADWKYVVVEVRLHPTPEDGPCPGS